MITSDAYRSLLFYITFVVLVSLVQTPCSLYDFCGIDKLANSQHSQALFSAETSRREDTTSALDVYTWLACRLFTRRWWVWSRKLMATLVFLFAPFSLILNGITLRNWLLFRAWLYLVAVHLAGVGRLVFQLQTSTRRVSCKLGFTSCARLVSFWDYPLCSFHTMHVRTSPVLNAARKCRLVVQSLVGIVHIMSNRAVFVDISQRPAFISTEESSMAWKPSPRKRTFRRWSHVAYLRQSVILSSSPRRHWFGKDGFAFRRRNRHDWWARSRAILGSIIPPTIFPTWRHGWLPWQTWMPSSRPEARSRQRCLVGRRRSREAD